MLKSGVATKFRGDLNKDLFRGFAVKKLAMENQNRINFHSHDKVLLKSCVEFYHECCKRRCIVLCNLEAQNKVLQKKHWQLQEKKVKINHEH